MPMSPRLLRPRQTIHPETASWASRVVANGASVSGTTLSAVDKFVKACYANNIRNRFYRLNLFCGTGLNACLVPLYRGPSLGGTQYGNATDTNVGGLFVSGDYNETGASGGLTGNGSSKYLDTGVAPSLLPSYTSAHISVYHTQQSATNQTRAWIGCSDTAGAAQVYLSNGIFGTSAVYGSWMGNATANFNTGGSQTGAAAGMRVLSRTSASSLDNYYNAISQASNTSDITGAMAGVTNTRPLFVFATNLQGTASQFANGRIMAYSIGLGLSGSQVSALGVAVQNFQTALSRNV